MKKIHVQRIAIKNNDQKQDIGEIKLIFYGKTRKTLNIKVCLFGPALSHLEDIVPLY